MTAQEFNYQLIVLRTPLFKYAYSLTKNSEDAEDLLQETFFKAIKFRNKFEDQTNQKAWTYTIMRNTFINNYRKSTRAKTKFYDKDFVYFSRSNKNSNHRSPESEYREKEIKKAINNLEDKFKNPFLMHLEGYKYNEIANKLNLNLGTVKSRIFLCRKKLMEDLKEYN